MASKNVQFKFDFNTKDVEIASDRVLTLREQIKLLQAQIQKTPTGTKEFEILSSKLNDTKDKFAQVSTKSREFFDTLSLIPGPVGDIASLKDFSLSVFNRWGQLIFQTNNPYQKWDGKYKGKTMDPAVFVYFIKASFTNDTKIDAKGNISLIR